MVPAGAIGVMFHIKELLMLELCKRWTKEQLMQIDPTHQQYVEADGSMVVQLDKALFD